MSWAPEEAILEKEEGANEDLQKDEIYLILTMRALGPSSHPQAEQGGEKSAQLEHSFWIAIVATWGCNQLNYTYNKRSSMRETGISEENL